MLGVLPPSSRRFAGSRNRRAHGEPVSRPRMHADHDILEDSQVREQADYSGRCGRTPAPPIIACGRKSADLFAGESEYCRDRLELRPVDDVEQCRFGPSHWGPNHRDDRFARGTLNSTDRNATQPAKSARFRSETASNGPAREKRLDRRRWRGRRSKPPRPHLGRLLIEAQRRNAGASPGSAPSRR